MAVFACFANTGAIKQALALRYPLLSADAIERRAAPGFVHVEGGLRPRADRSALLQTCDGLRADLVPALRDIRVPTLLVRGADSRFVSAAGWAKTRRLRSDLTAIEIEGADHYVSEEAYAVLAEAIVDFWIHVHGA